MDGANEELLERLRKKFEVVEEAEQKQSEEIVNKKLDEFSRSLDSLRSEIVQNRAALEELKAQVGRTQPEVKAEELRAIDRKIEELSKAVGILRSEIRGAMKPVAAEVKAEEKAKEEDTEERFVISPKTGVIEKVKVKAKKIDYIEAKPSAVKEKEKEKTKGKKEGIIEAEDSTPEDAKGGLFKRLKEIK